MGLIIHDAVADILRGRGTPQRHVSCKTASTINERIRTRRLNYDLKPYCKEENPCLQTLEDGQTQRQRQFPSVP